MVKWEIRWYTCAVETSEWKDSKTGNEPEADAKRSRRCNKAGSRRNEWFWKPGGISKERLPWNFVYRSQILKFTYLWHKGLLPKLFSNYFQYASNVHKYNTRYASKQNLYVKKVRTNMGKQTIGYAACVIWDKIPLNLKELSIYQFSKQLKPYLLSEQHN